MPSNAFLDRSVVDIMIVLFLCFIGSSFFLTLHTMIMHALSKTRILLMFYVWIF